MTTNSENDVEINEDNDEESFSKSFFSENLIVEMALRSNPFDQTAVQTISQVLDKYQEQCELLDPHLTQMMQLLLKQIDPITDYYSPTKEQSLLLGNVCNVVYHLCKVRGFKTISRYFPHDVAKVEPLVRVIMSISQHSTDWTIKYTFMLWLAIAMLVPFDLSSLDSDGTLTEYIYNLGTLSLSETGPTRDIAALMLARMLMRKDTVSYLHRFVQWSVQTLNSLDHAKASIFTRNGLLRCLVNLCKLCDRHAIIPFLPQLHLITTSHHDQSVTIRHLYCKLLCRMALLYMKPIVAPWRYQRSVKALATKSSNNSTQVSSEENIDDEQVDIPEQLESIIQSLLDSLRDEDTIVRWSAAKGIGRVTATLPLTYGEDVVLSICSILSEGERDSAWHGGCLALAELSRRGLLLPVHLENVVPIAIKALQYEVRIGTYSVGAHVRDAACYVVWAFARAYSSDILAPFGEMLSQALLTVCVYDREINVRRAAAAAYQENVGRQSGTMPNSITINTIADYFTVSNRSNSYLIVAKEVAQFHDYATTFATHLAFTKSNHWQKDIRDLAS